MNLLLKHNADVTLQNDQGHTAIEIASPKIRQMMLDSSDGGTVQQSLHQAAWQGNFKLVKRIMVTFYQMFCYETF